MKKVPCRYFAKKGRCGRMCPFGRDCFYAHRNEDGSEYVFPHGVDIERYMSLRVCATSSFYLTVSHPSYPIVLQASNRNHTNQHGFLFRTSNNPPSGFAFEAALDAIRVNMAEDFQQRDADMLGGDFDGERVRLHYGPAYNDDDDDEFEESGEENEVSFSDFFHEVYGHGYGDGDEIDLLEQFVSSPLYLT